MRMQERTLFSTRTHWRWKIALLIAALAPILSVGSAEAIHTEATSTIGCKIVSRVYGQVWWRWIRGQTWVPILVSKELCNDQMAKTGPNSQAKILLEDDKDIRIHSDTVVEMSKIDYSEKVKTTRLKQVWGRIRVRILGKKAGVDELVNLETPAAVLGARGTEFDVEVGGGQIVMSTYWAFGAREVRLLNPDGTYAAINPPNFGEKLSWSPDGAKLAYFGAAWIPCSGSQYGCPAIYVVNRDGSVVTRYVFPPNSSAYGRIAWSPDGTRLAFFFDPYVCNPQQGTCPPSRAMPGIYAMPAAGGTPSPLYLWQGECGIDDGVLCPGADVDWSVDGRLAYPCSRSYTLPNGQEDTYLFLCVDGATITGDFVSPSGPVCAVRSAGLDPDWSPDGTKIAFTSGCRVGDFNLSIAVVNADGSNPRLVTSGPEDDDPTWSPDGTILAFRRWMGYPAVWRVNADGSDAINLTPNDIARGPDWSPSTWTKARVYDGIVDVSRRDGTGTVQATAAQMVMVDATVNNGLPQPPAAFTLPPTLNLLSPSDGSNYTTAPTLAWQAFPGTATYAISLLGPTNETQTGPLSAGLWVSGTVTSSDLTPDWQYMAEGEWRWRVDAMDASQNILAMSPWRRFTKSSPSPPRIVSFWPDNVATTILTPTLRFDFNATMNAASVDGATLTLASGSGTLFSNTIGNLRASNTIATSWSAFTSTFWVNLAATLLTDQTYTVNFSGPSVTDLGGQALSPSNYTAKFNTVSPIGSSGGSVGTPNSARVDIGAGALTTTTPIEIYPTSPAALASPPQGRYVVPGTAYDLLPDHQVFSKPVSITLSLPPSVVNPTIAYESGGSWTVLGGAISGGSISVTTTHFTPFAVLGTDNGAPAAPAGLTATAGDTIIDLRWNSNTDPDVAGYQVYYAAASWPVEQIMDVGNRTSGRLSGLHNGEIHYVAVKAYDYAGNASPLSAQVSATPQGQARIYLPLILR